MSFSLLYIDDENQNFIFNSELIADLQLDDMCKRLFQDEININSENFLSLLCTKTNDITYRQQIVNDLIINPNLMKSFCDISKELKKLTEIKRIYDDSKEVWIKYDFLFKSLSKYVECIDLLVDSFELNVNIYSKGLIDFKQWISMKYEKEDIKLLKIKLNDIKKEYKTVKGLIAGVNVNENCEPQAFTIEKLIYEDYSLNGIPNNIKSSQGLISINTQIKLDSSKNNQLLSLFINKKLQKILKDQTNLIKINLLKFADIDFSSLTHQYTALIFYHSAVKWHSILDAKGLKITQPIVHKDEFKFYAKECYSPILALKMNAFDISSNDIHIYKDIHVITGANSAGKTTMLRTIALNQLLFYAGLHVCAEKAELSVSNKIFSSFSTGEIIEDSRFGMEVARIKNILETSDCNSLVLLNEPFTSTNPTEGVKICKETIEKFVQNGTKVITVTHYYELYSLLKKDGFNVESLIMKEVYENEKEKLLGKHKHKLLVQEPDGINFAKDIADQFGFNIDKILNQFSIKASDEKYSFIREMIL